MKTALVLRNGYHNACQVLCRTGSIEVRALRVNDRRVDETTDERKRFRSAILPPYMRCSPKVCEGLPLLYLHRLSSGDFAPAIGCATWSWWGRGSTAPRNS